MNDQGRRKGSLTTGRAGVPYCLRTASDLQKLQGTKVEKDMGSPDEVRARLCEQGHPSCIEGFVPSATGDHIGLAGWWHFTWDQEASQWNLTDPSGGSHFVVVQLADAPYPPAALVDAIPGLTLQPVVSTILEKGLFPPDAID